MLSLRAKLSVSTKPHYRTSEMLHDVGLAGKCVLSERHKESGFISSAEHQGICLIYVWPAVHAWEGRGREIPLACAAGGDEACKALELL